MYHKILMTREIHYTNFITRTKKNFYEKFKNLNGMFESMTKIKWLWKSGTE